MTGYSFLFSSQNPFKLALKPWPKPKEPKDTTAIEIAVEMREDLAFGHDVQNDSTLA